MHTRSCKVAMLGSDYTFAGRPKSQMLGQINPDFSLQMPSSIDTSTMPRDTTSYSKPEEKEGWLDTWGKGIVDITKYGLEAFKPAQTPQVPSSMQPTFWDRNKDVIIAGGAAALLLGTVIAVTRKPKRRRKNPCGRTRRNSTLYIRHK